MSKPIKNPQNSSFKLPVPLCHQLPERTIYFRNKPLPLCARCTGILIGVFTLPVFHWGLINPNWINIILLALPAVLDASTQYLRWRESNNSLRLMTGFLLGCAIAAFIVIAGKSLVNFLTP